MGALPYIAGFCIYVAIGYPVVWYSVRFIFLSGNEMADQVEYALVGTKQRFFISALLWPMVAYSMLYGAIRGYVKYKKGD